MPASKNSLPEPAKHLLTKLPTAHDFLSAYNSHRITALCAAAPERCYFGDAPTLATISQAYSRRTAIQWLGLVIHDIIAASGASSEAKTADDTPRRAAETILAEFPFLNAAEILLFAHRFQAGRYGRFYGSFSTIDLCHALRFSFLRERSEAILHQETLRDAREREEAAANAISRSEYERLTWLAYYCDEEAIEKLSPPEEK